MVTVRSRQYWGARAPKSRNTISTPVQENWGHHTAGSEAGVSGMKSIQRYHMDTKGWSDIGYSWVYDKDEQTWYEGRGWGVSGAHTYGHNSVSHGFCVMGNFNNETVPQSLIDDFAWMLVEGYKAGHGPKYLTGGHRDVSSTSCPGDNLYDAIPLINKKVDELLNAPASTEPEDKDWAFPEAAGNLTAAGIYSKWTGPGANVDTDNLSAYLDRLLRSAAGLVRIDSSASVFHVVGQYLVPLTDPKQAELLVAVAGGNPANWQDYVFSITQSQANAFITLERGALGPHTHDEYAPKKHSHNYAGKGHTHDAAAHSHTFTGTTD